METKYPKEISMRSGCKVSWLTYDNLSDATKASEVAIQEGYRLEDLGYDFGFQSIGYISKTKDKDEWTVVIP